MWVYMNLTPRGEPNCAKHVLRLKLRKHSELWEPTLVPNFQPLTQHLQSAPPWFTGLPAGSAVPPGVRVAVGWEATLVLMSLAMVWKACSTLCAFLALVSMNWMPKESESSLASS